MPQVFNVRGEPLLAELLPLGVDGLGNAIAEDDQPVAVLQLHRFLFERRQFEEADHHAAQIQPAPARSADQERWQMSGVRVGQASVSCDRRVEHGCVSRRNRPAQHGLVGERERGRGAALFRTDRKNRLKRCAQKRRRRSLARDVPERERNV